MEVNETVNDTIPEGYQEDNIPLDNIISHNYGFVSNPQWIHSSCPSMNLENLNIIYETKFSRETQEIINIHKHFIDMNTNDINEELTLNEEVIEHQKKTDTFLESFNTFMKSFQEQRDKTSSAEKDYKINLEKTQNDVDKITDFKEFMVKMDTKYKDVIPSEINESIIEVANKIRENNECEKMKEEYLLQNHILQQYWKCIQNINALNKGSTCSLCLQRQVDTFMEPCGHTGCSECIEKLKDRFGEYNCNCFICRKKVLQFRKLYFS